MQNNSLQVKSSRYVSGGVTETNGRAIEWWERVVLETAPDDTQFVVEKRFAGRLDLIAAVFLDEPRYWWVIAQLNNILDPASEVVEGIVLRIPSRERMKLILGGKLGGVPSTRDIKPSVFPIV